MERGVGRRTRLFLLTFLLVLASVASSAWAASSGGVTFHATRKVAGDGLVMLSGTVPRVTPGSRVIVERRSGAGWLVVAAGRVAKHGRFRLTWPAPQKAGVVSVRAVGYRGSKLVGTSRVRRVDVFRHAGGAVTVSPRTQVLAASTVVSASPDGKPAELVVAGGNEVSVGQIIAIGAGLATPDGFLGQVTAVSVSGGETTVQTKPATLMQAVPVGSFDVSMSQAPQGNSVRHGVRRAHDSHADCNGSVAASVDADASVGLTIRAKGDWSWLRGGVQSASLSAGASASASVTATVEGAGSCKLDPVQILKLKGPGDTFFVGPVPVVVTSQVLVDLDASASVGAKVTTGISGGYSATAGIGWTKSGGFYPIDSFGPTFKYTAPTLSANADVEASLDPTIQVSIDGGGHADLNLSAGLDLTADTTANPWWALTAPVSVTGDLDISKLDLKSPTLTLYKHSFTLVQASGPFGGTGGTAGIVTVMNPGNQTGAVGVPVSLQIQATDSDGGALAYAAAGLAAGLSINSTTGLITGTPTTAGNPTSIITARDPSGPSAQTTFSWTITGSSGPAGPAAQEVSVGNGDACALLSGGGVDCWGQNGFGTLADGASTGPEACGANPCSTTPAPVDGLAAASGIATSDTDACAVLSGGDIDCWGDNSLGELGDATTAGPDTCGSVVESCSTNPTTVSTITDATQIATSAHFECALLSVGSIDCWGYNQSGQLGDGTSSGPNICGISTPCGTTPEAVDGITTATQVATSDNAEDACALLSNGTVDCWGDNLYGELGDGSDTGPDSCAYAYTCSTTPVAVNGITTATQITEGTADACALLANGSVECWGVNDYGQLGDGTSSGPSTCEGFSCSTTPVAVSGITDATQITNSGTNTCALLSNGSVDCWGFNQSGQLGDGTTTGPETCMGGGGDAGCSTTPVTVSAITNATQISTGEYGTCALLSGGRVDCWGDDSLGELGDGTTTSSDVPVAVSGFG